MLFLTINGKPVATVADHKIETVIYEVQNIIDAEARSRGFEYGDLVSSVRYI